jgi:hypothetical protein
MLLHARAGAALPRNTSVVNVHNATSCGQVTNVIVQGGGVAGPQGERGPTGLTGPAGPRGETGPAGRQIQQ